MWESYHVIAKSVSENYSSQCENKSQVEPFRAISFSSEAGEIESFEIDSSVDDSQVIDTTPLDYTNLIGVDSFVAIKLSSDAIYSFFVLHCVWIASYCFGKHC